MFRFAEVLCDEGGASFLEGSPEALVPVQADGRGGEQCGVVDRDPGPGQALVHALAVGICRPTRLATPIGTVGRCDGDRSK